MINTSIPLKITLLLLITSVATCQSPSFDQDNSFAYLIKQCSFGPRNPGSDGYDACHEWLEQTLRTFNAQVYLQKFKAREALTGNDHELTNIIAYFPGDADRPTMLCAHWDTRIYADKDPDPANQKKPVLGANDGASGVAVLLEIARIASEHPPPLGLLIVLFDGEDMGRSHYSEEFALGSKYWASHQVPVQVEEAILLDMVGDSDLEIQIEGYSERNAPYLRRYLWEIAKNLDLPAFSEEFGSTVLDDHVRLQRAGIRAVDLIDFDYPAWHTTEDTPDKCSAESLGQVGKLLIEFIYH